MRERANRQNRLLDPHFTPDELWEYEDSLKSYRDIKNSLDTARAEGREEGREQGRAEGEKNRAVNIARNLIKAGMDVKTVSRMTGLSMEETGRLG